MQLADRAFYAALTAASLAALGWGFVAGGGEGLAFALFAVLVLAGSLLCVIGAALWEAGVHALGWGS